MQRLDAAHPQDGSLQPGPGPHQGCCQEPPLRLQAWVEWPEPGGGAGAGASWGGDLLAVHAAMTLQTDP